MPRRSAVQVAGSRAQTLDAAVELASVVGLEGLTIGHLAEELAMSKSGLVGRFGSKEQLQLAALALAVEIFRDAVYVPAAAHPAGLRRLDAICDAWIDYLGHPPFSGGCFLTTASVEFDARPGPVNQAVRNVMNRWIGVLEGQARVAVEHGELSQDSDPEDIAFTINALAVGANCHYQLHRDPSALERARRAMAAVLDSRRSRGEYDTPRGDPPRPTRNRRARRRHPSPPTLAPRSGFAGARDGKREAMARKGEIVKRLLDRHGQTYAQELGIKLEAGSPSALFQWLSASILYSARIGSAIAAEAFRNMKRHGWQSARALAGSTWDQRVAELNKAGYARYQERTATMLGDMSEFVLDRWQGDLRKLRDEAEEEPRRERTLLKELKGLGDVGVDIFFREVQVIWPELAPFADRRALKTAEQLGLGNSADDLRRLVSADSDFTRLVAALVRAGFEGDLQEITG
jgi:AcrR family transcriptional regulator